MLLLRGATRRGKSGLWRSPVSIHAPLARSNARRAGDAESGTVSIHAPLARSNATGKPMVYRISVSIHAPLARSNFEEKRPYYSTIKVSIHAPLARSNRVSHISRIRRVVSIHAPLARSNGSRQLHSERRRCFNTCSSCEEQLSCLRYLCLQPKFQYMLLLRGATRFKVKGHCSLNVSIHAPLARSNLPGLRRSVSCLFQYMLLLRGATCIRTGTCRPSSGFNTCSSCEEQLFVVKTILMSNLVSIHAPLARSNMKSRGMSPVTRVSIHAPLARSNIPVCGPQKGRKVSIHAPLARSNLRSVIAPAANSVSIHAPLARSNGCLSCSSTLTTGFNTCSSCEEQRAHTGPYSDTCRFQYMLLLRGATL